MNKQLRQELIGVLEVEINKAFERMNKLEVNSEEWNEEWNYIQHCELKIKEVKDTKKKFKFEVNEKWIPVIGSVISILLIMSHEKANVITTKAFGFIPKGRG